MEHECQRGARCGSSRASGPHAKQGFPPRLRGVLEEAEAGFRGRLMAVHDDRLKWPFFEEPHRRLATEAERWADATLTGEAHPVERAAVDARCRALVGRLGN